MKKSLFYISVSLVVLSSCAKEIEQIKEDKIDIINEENPIQGPSKESVVIYGEVNTTKTTVDGSGIFAWQTGEKIAVVEQDMTDSDGLEFTLSNASTGAFTGTKTDGKDLVYAVSPQSALSEASEDGGVVMYSLTLPATYSNYVSGTTNDIMVGTPDPGYSGDGYKFIFRQATALLKFTYANVPYGTKKFKLTTPEYITGEWLLGTTSGVSLDQTTSGGTTVTITLASTVETVGQTMTFCVPVPAGNYTGFEIELQDAAGNTLTGTNKSKSGLDIDLSAGDIFPCPTVTLTAEALASLDYTDDGIGSIITTKYDDPHNVDNASGTWVVCAYKNAGMQLNTASKVSYITTPYILGTIKTIVVTGTNPTYYYGNNINTSTSGGVQGSSIDGKSIINLSSKEWSQAHIVTSGGAAVATHVDVIYTPKEIDHITLTTAPTKTSYTYGESFDFTGAVVTAYYKDDTNSNITALVSTDGDTVVGAAGDDQTVTISYGGKTTTFTIDVAKAEAGLEYATTAFDALPNASFPTPELINPFGVTVTYSSSNTSLVTVNSSTGAITIGSSVGGPVTITATTTGNSNVKAGNASYTITILSKVALPTPSSVTISSITASSITGTWTLDGNADDYEWIVTTSSTYAGIVHSGGSKNVIFEGDMSSGEYSDDGTTCTITKSGLTLSGKYYLYVTAKGDGSTYDDSEDPGVASLGIITLTQSSLGITATGYDSGAERTQTISSISFGSVYTMKNGTNIQGKSGSMKIYNTSTMGSIKSIAMTQTGSATVTLNASESTSKPSKGSITGVTSSKTTTWDLSGSTYGYFNMVSPSGVIYISSIVIIYN